MPKDMELSVVGINYRATSRTLETLVADVPLHCELEREPDNSHDPNAVKVIITEKPYAKAHGGFHVGYVARTSAAVIAPAMDEGGASWPYNDVWLVSVDPATGRGELVVSRRKKQ